MYRVEQYVMAYRADHEKIRKLIPEGFESLRPVLRINVEIITDYDEIEGEQIYIEFNTPVAGYGKRGWLNLTAWDTKWTEITGIRNGKNVSFTTDFDGVEFLDIRFSPVGKEGGCPREDDNDGIFFIDAEADETVFAEAEVITGNKEFCDCSFTWCIPDSDFFSEKPALIKEAMRIPCEEILGAYMVIFDREE